MSFQDAVRTVLTTKFATFTGRARRSEFWWFALLEVVVAVLAQAIDRAVFSGRPILYVLTALALLVPALAVGARRLHDTGRSGWWQLLALIPIVGAIVLIVWFVQDGHAAPNQHGVNPKQLSAPAEAAAAL